MAAAPLPLAFVGQRQNTIRNYIAKKIAPLASRLAQDRWIVHATADECLLVSELLNDACDAHRYATQAHVRTTLTESAVVELRKLAELARDINVDSIPADTLIQSDPQWAHLRQQAQRCLGQIGFDLSKWEQREGLSTTNDIAD